MRLRNRIYIDIQFSRFPERFQENFSPISLLSTEFSIDKQDFSLRISLILRSLSPLFILLQRYAELHFSKSMCLCIIAIFKKISKKNGSSRFLHSILDRNTLESWTYSKVGGFDLLERFKRGCE